MKLNKQYLMGLIANILLFIGFVISFASEYPDSHHKIVMIIGFVITIVSTAMAITLYVRMTMGHIGHDKDGE